MLVSVKPPLSNNGSIDALSTLTYTLRTVVSCYQDVSYICYTASCQYAGQIFFKMTTSLERGMMKHLIRGASAPPGSLRGVEAPKIRPENSGKCTSLQEEGNRL